MSYNVLKQKSFFLLVAFILADLSGTAQAAERAADFFTCTSPLGLSQAAQLSSKVQSAYRKVSSLEGSFLQFSYLSSLDEEQQSSGTMWFLRPGKMRWNYRSPDEQEFIIRDNTVWFYQKEDHQVLIDEFDKVLLSDLPVAFLAGVGDLGSSFTLKSACRAGTHALLEFAPSRTEAGNELHTFRLLVDEKKHLPAGAQVVDISGNVTSIALSSVKTDSPRIQDALFSMDLPAGVDINDRRALKSERDLVPLEEETNG